MSVTSNLLDLRHRTALTADQGLPVFVWMSSSLKDVAEINTNFVAFKYVQFGFSKVQYTKKQS